MNEEITKLIDETMQNLTTLRELVTVERKPTEKDLRPPRPPIDPVIAHLMEYMRKAEGTPDAFLYRMIVQNWRGIGKQGQELPPVSESQLAMLRSPDFTNWRWNTTTNNWTRTVRISKAREVLRIMRSILDVDHQKTAPKKTRQNGREDGEADVSGNLPIFQPTEASDGVYVCEGGHREEVVVRLGVAGDEGGD